MLLPELRMPKFMELFKRPISRNHFMWQMISYGLALMVLSLVFMSYYAPDMMVAMTNQVWALCGW